jgi:hypothetical protein
MTLYPKNKLYKMGENFWRVVLEKRRVILPIFTKISVAF